MWWRMNHSTADTQHWILAAGLLAALHLQPGPLHLHSPMMRIKEFLAINHPAYVKVLIAPHWDLQPEWQIGYQLYAVWATAAVPAVQFPQSVFWHFDWKRIAYHVEPVLGQQRMTEQGEHMKEDMRCSSRILSGVASLSFVCDSRSQPEDISGFSPGPLSGSGGRTVCRENFTTFANTSALQ